MTIKDHEHRWEEDSLLSRRVLPKRTVLELGLRLSRYDQTNGWYRGKVCTTEACDAGILIIRDLSVLRYAVEQGYPPYSDRPDGEITGIIIDTTRINNRSGPRTG